MKAEKVINTNMATEAEELENRDEEPQTASTALTEPRDTATLCRELLDISPEEFDRIYASSRETKRLKKVKPVPDSRYTEQAILDREILGLKKFYS
jgi:hypothetical protein